MMLCVMDVMGPGCSAAWWQTSPLATFEDKLAVIRFYSLSPLWIFAAAGPIVILHCTRAGHTMYSIMPLYLLFCIVLFCLGPAARAIVDLRLDFRFHQTPTVAT